MLASYPGSNYAGEGKRAWYLQFAVALDFPGISGNSILPYSSVNDDAIAGRTYVRIL